jgi:hypothetical protein
MNSLCRQCTTHGRASVSSFTPQGVKEGCWKSGGLVLERGWDGCMCRHLHGSYTRRTIVIIHSLTPRPPAILCLSATSAKACLTAAESLRNLDEMRLGHFLVRANVVNGQDKLLKNDLPTEGAVKCSSLVDS